MIDAATVAIGGALVLGVFLVGFGVGYFVGWRRATEAGERKYNRRLMMR